MQSELRGNSVLIVGYGREGKSSHRFLLKQHPNLRIGIADKNSVSLIPEAVKNTETFVGSNYLDAADSFDTILRSPGIPLFRGDLEPLLAKGMHISSLCNVFMECARGTLIGVSGTKGKSTTSALLFDLLKSSFPDVRLVGNIGTPALDSLDGANESTIFVAELSSFQLEDLRHRPQIAVLLDIVPEHLDHHGSFEAYRNAKLRIADAQTTVVCNASLQQNFSADLEDDTTFALFSDSKRNSAEAASLAYLDQDSVHYLTKEGETLLCSSDDLQLPLGRNAQNVLAALSVASVLKLKPELVRKALLSFKPLPHRLEHIGDYKGIGFYNDSLATIPEACMHALSSLGEAVQTLIIGGHDRGVSYEELAKDLAERKSYLDHVILLPDTGRTIESLIQEGYPEALNEMTLHPVKNMEEAVELSYKCTQPGRICLLSPASSSLNQFRDYQERGDVFHDFVAKYATT